MSSTGPADVPRRPRAVWLGIPYLALLWFPMSGYVMAGPLPSPAEVVLGILLTTLWGALLGWAWHGRPVAVQVLALLAMVAAGGLLLFKAIIPGMFGLVYLDDAAPGEVVTLLAGLLGFAVVNALGLAAGLALRRPRVAAWSEARHPVQTPPGDAVGRPGPTPES